MVHSAHSQSYHCLAGHAGQAMATGVPHKCARIAPRTMQSSVVPQTRPSGIQGPRNRCVVAPSSSIRSCILFRRVISIHSTRSFINSHSSHCCGLYLAHIPPSNNLHTHHVAFMSVQNAFSQGAIQACKRFPRFYLLQPQRHGTRDILPMEPPC